MSKKLQSQVSLNMSQNLTNLQIKRMQSHTSDMQVKQLKSQNHIETSLDFKNHQSLKFQKTMLSELHQDNARKPLEEIDYLVKDRLFYRFCCKC